MSAIAECIQALNRGGVEIGFAFACRWTRRRGGNFWIKLTLGLSVRDGVCFMIYFLGYPWLLI